MTQQRGFLSAISTFGGVVSSTLRYKRWARWTLNATVLALVSVSLVSRAQSLRQPPSVPTQAIPTIAPPTSDMPTILSANLFGVDQMNPSGAMARTTLNLVVTGLFAAGANSGMALMSVDGQPETSFGTGDEILPGVRLHAVEEERIIISRSGLLETVPLKEFVSSGKSSLVIATAETDVPGSISPWAGNKGFMPLAANTVAADDKAGTSGSATPAGPRNLNRNHKQHKTTGPGANTGATGTSGTVSGPQPPAPAAGQNSQVPRAPTGGAAPQVPRPPTGTPVPEIPRPPAGGPISGPPLPTQK